MSKNTNLSFLTDYITADITNGRIGINNASPTVAFDVVGVAKFSSSVTATNITNNGIYYGKANASFPTTSLGYFALKTNNLDAERGGLTVQVSNSTSTFIDALSINYTGAATFSSSVTAGDLITASYGTARIQITSTTNSVNAGLRFTAKDSTGTNKNAGVYYVAGTTTANSFISLSSDDNTYLFNVLANGNVGIGTSSPSTNTNQTSLTINGALVSRVDMQVGGTRNAGFVVATDAAYLETTAAIPLVFYTNSVERMRITSGGVVQIGATSLPSGASADSGSMFINSNLFIGNSNGTTGYAFRFDGFANALYASWTSASGVDVGGVYLNYGGTSWTANSDERLKDINSKIENAVDKLKTLRAINYSWKSDETKKENLGLIAQDVEKVFPEVIGINKDGYLGVRYTELIPVLVKAIQELKAEIETLKNK